MSSGSIRLSPKHGVNPSLGVCFWCGEDSGEIILPGLMKGDAAAPHRAVWNLEPCDKCKRGMALGVALIECDDHENGNPQIQKDPVAVWPTGRWLVLKPEAIERIFDAGAAAQIMKHRKAFLDHETFEKLNASFEQAGITATHKVEDL